MKCVLVHTILTDIILLFLRNITYIKPYFSFFYQNIKAYFIFFKYAYNIRDKKIYV